MNALKMTANQIHEFGIEELLNKLGPVGTIRFLHQYEAGKGNYSVDRQQWLTVPDIEALANQMQRSREDNSSSRV